MDDALKAILKSLDDNVEGLSLSQYVELLETLQGDVEVRLEATRHDLEREQD